MPLDANARSQRRVEGCSINVSAISDAHNDDNIASDFTINLQSRTGFIKTFSPEFSSGAHRKFFAPAMWHITFSVYVIQFFVS